MTRVAVVLLVLLVASIGMNVWQFGSASTEAGREEVRAVLDVELARVRGVVQAMEENAERSAAIADVALADNTSLLSDLAEIVDRGRKRVTIYRDRIADAPALSCPPGPERMDAINGILGGGP